MRSIAVMNQKGGVGKTRPPLNLSAALAEAGARLRSLISTRRLMLHCIWVSRTRQASRRSMRC